MIVQLKGKCIAKKENSIILDVSGVGYEVLIPLPVLKRLETSLNSDTEVSLIIYHYFQLEPSRGVPVLIGFMNEIERDFFLQFITVSGIGPRAAVRALNCPIPEITRAIDQNDLNFLKTLPGIGAQRAKEIVAKLQGKLGKFGLIQEEAPGAATAALKSSVAAPNWQAEALDVLLQLQYRRQEALAMIEKALERSKDLNTTEDLLNEIYKQKVKK